jgi:FixJ family two-component response regulator
MQRDLAQANAQLPIIFITGYGDIPMATRAMNGGAVNFLTKPFRDQELLDAVYAGLKRHRVQLRQDHELAELRARLHSLSPREREILPLVTGGLLNKQIAANVGLSEVTVKVHRHKLMVKLNAKNLPELVRMADALAIRSGSLDGKAHAASETTIS